MRLTLAETPLPETRETPTVYAPLSMPTLEQMTKERPSLKQTPTATQAPALTTKEEVAAFVADMQATNGECELPCWWGITPGKTTGQDAKQRLSPLRKFGENYMLGSIYMSYLELHVYANLGFGVRVETKTSESQPVNRVIVESFTTLIDDSVRYDENWRRYFIYDLFTRLGQPSEVWLGFGPYGTQENKRYFYELMVFYEELGLTVEYAGPAVKGDPDRACPTLEQLKLLRLNAQNPSDPKIIRPPGPGEPFTDLRPISEVTKLSPASFYENSVKSSGLRCLESPAKFWP